MAAHKQNLQYTHKDATLPIDVKLDFKGEGALPELEIEVLVRPQADWKARAQSEPAAKRAYHEIDQALSRELTADLRKDGLRVQKEGRKIILTYGGATQRRAESKWAFLMRDPFHHRATHAMYEAMVKAIPPIVDNAREEEWARAQLNSPPPATAHFREEVRGRTGNRQRLF